MTERGVLLKSWEASAFADRPKTVWDGNPWAWLYGLGEA